MQRGRALGVRILPVVTRAPHQDLQVAQLNLVPVGMCFVLDYIADLILEDLSWSSTLASTERVCTSTSVVCSIELVRFVEMFTVNCSFEVIYMCKMNCMFYIKRRSKIVYV